MDGSYYYFTNARLMAFSPHSNVAKRCRLDAQRTLNASVNGINFGSGDGLVPDDNSSSADPLQTYRQLKYRRLACFFQRNYINTAVLWKSSISNTITEKSQILLKL